MSDLLNNFTDDEVEKYNAAARIKQAGLDIKTLKNKKSVYNPETKTHDILTQMSSGGYVKIGEESLDLETTRPGSILLNGMEYGRETPEYQRYYPDPEPQPNVMTVSPSIGQVEEAETAPLVSEQLRIESAKDYAEFLNTRGGATAQDLLAAGYTPEIVNTVMGGTTQDNMPNEVTRTEPLSTEEVENIIRSGGSVIGEYDPTLRETGKVELTQYLLELAENSLAEDLRTELLERGSIETDGRLIQPLSTEQINQYIQTELEAQRPRLINEANALSGMFFGSPSSLGIGVGDFVTAGIMDIQEGSRLFAQGQAGDNVADRAFGALLVIAGLAEATGVGMLVGKAIKKSIPTLRAGLADVGERLNQPGEMPTVGSNFGNVGQLNKPPLADSLPGRISTRLPTAKQIEEDPMSGELIIGLEEMKKDPKLFDFNVNITKDYPNMRLVEDETVDETSERFIEHVKDNLLYLHDQVPDATRARSQKWYDGARAITNQWSEEYGVPDTSIAGVLAALSPQKDWYQNVSLAQRTLDVAIKQKDFKMSNQMTDLFFSLKDQKGKPVFDKPKYRPLLDSIQGKSYSEIIDDDPKVQATLRALFVRLYDQTYNKPDYRIVGPEGDFLDIATNADGSPSKAAWGSLNEISKAVASIDAAGDVNTISRLMGERHKVRNFYNNIYDPNSPFGDVTIDTHAVAAGLLRPLSGNSLEVDHNFKNMSVKGRGTTKGSSKTGVSGNYGLYAEAYRRAAAERGILPRQMQSITWEAVRGLFTDKFKQNAKNVTDINEIWQRYKNGEIELDETRRLVNERAGGVNAPSWE